MAVKSKRKKNPDRQHFVMMHRDFMETAAWRALSPTAQRLYVWLKLEWHGPRTNNNGKLSLSVRQAAEKLPAGINTAARAFRELQAKGFAVQTKGAYLGTEGEGKSPEYEVTELPLPGRPVGRRLYLEWKRGQDFDVHLAPANNPTGRRTKKKSRHRDGDDPVTELVTFPKRASLK